MPVLGVIPARLGSTRLARKPLQLLGGEPLIVRVLERVRQVPVFGAVVVATDAPEVAAVVERVGGRVVMTSSLHESGTDRVAEVARSAGFTGFDVIVNVQGDEPFLPEEAIRGAIDRVVGGDDVGTAAVPLDPGLAGEPSRVKVVTDRRGRALYFSRAPIPHRRDPAETGEGLYWQHLGVYAYSRPALGEWVAAPPTVLERAERLEQLRALELGLSIGVAHLARPAPPGIDTAEDLERAERLWTATALEDSR
ncbi:MAG: 3-deoxy-manno-octulosonate cytidylyltransferase [Gemmatimonadales bacterium]